MPATHVYPAGSGAVVLGDNTDDPTIQTVDVMIDIPLAGIHLHGPSYSVEIDGVWQGTAEIDLDYGPSSIERRITYESFSVPTDASSFELDWPDTGSSGLGGAQTLTFDFIQLQKPFVWINVGGRWVRAITWVFFGGLMPDFPESGWYQRAKPVVSESGEWKELA